MTRDSRKTEQGGQKRGFQGKRYSKSPEGNRRKDKSRQERSLSRAEGSPVRLQGCMRCSSSNHRAASCTRFEFWEGKRCQYCGYLHDSRFCPFGSKDKRERKNKSEKNLLKDNDNSWRNAYQVEVLQQQNEDKLQDKKQSESGEYIPKVPQPGARQIQDNSNIFAKN